MKCVNHPEKDAVAMCVSCGVGLCSDCRKVVRGAGYCDDCKRTHQPMRVYPGGAGNGLNIWAIAAWVLAILGMWPQLTFVSVAAVVLAFVALGDMRLHTDQQSGRGYAIMALVIGMGGLAVKFGIFWYMLANGVEHSVFDPYKYLGIPDVF